MVHIISSVSQDEGQRRTTSQDSCILTYCSFQSHPLASLPLSSSPLWCLPKVSQDLQITSPVPNSHVANVTSILCHFYTVNLHVCACKCVCVGGMDYILYTTQVQAFLGQGHCLCRHLIITLCFMCVCKCLIARMRQLLLNIQFQGWEGRKVNLTSS